MFLTISKYGERRDRVPSSHPYAATYGNALASSRRLKPMQKSRQQRIADAIAKRIIGNQMRVKFSHAYADALQEIIIEDGRQIEGVPGVPATPEYCDHPGITENDVPEGLDA